MGALLRCFLMPSEPQGLTRGARVLRSLAQGRVPLWGTRTGTVWAQKVCSRLAQCVGLGSGHYLAVPCVVSEREEDASTRPHAGHGAGEEFGMGRVAP